MSRILTGLGRPKGWRSVPSSGVDLPESVLDEDGMKGRFIGLICLEGGVRWVG